MTKREKLVVSAFTGCLMTDFEVFHKFAEEKLGRELFTHELAFYRVSNELRESVRDEFLEICKGIDTVPVKQGHWIEHKRAEEFCGELISNWECSECHEWFREWGHYCSDCGAKMVE